MSNLIIAAIVILIVLVIILFFYTCSKLMNTFAGLSLVGVIICTVLLCFLCMEKNQVIDTGTDLVKIVNISYYCPECKLYIPSFETKFCSRCGKDLTYVKKGLEKKNGKKNNF